MKTFAATWLFASSLFLLSQAPLLTNARKALTSDEKHALKREVMHTAVRAAIRPPLADAFASDEERRSYYYFHAGVETAARNALKMAGRDVGDLAGSDEDEHRALLNYLEEALERELEAMRAQRKDVEHGKGNGEQKEYRSQPEGNAEEAGPADDREGLNKKFRSQPEGYVNEVDAEADEMIQKIFAKEVLHFQCGTHPNMLLMSIDDIQGKWKEMRRHFWELILGRPPPDDDGYVPNPDLYVDFVTKEDVDGNGNRRRGLFAARDFKRLEEVYSQRANRLYFPDTVAWTGFLHALPSNHDACLALEWSFMKQISRPGRWLVGLVLDEGAFMATSDQEKDSEDDEEKEDDEDDGSDGGSDDDVEDGAEKDGMGASQLEVNVSLEDDRGLEDSKEEGNKDDKNYDNSIGDENDRDSEVDEEEEEDGDDDSNDNQEDSIEDCADKRGGHFEVNGSLEDDSGLEDSEEEGAENDEADENDKDNEKDNESGDDEEEVDDDGSDDYSDDYKDENIDDGADKGGGNFKVNVSVKNDSGLDGNEGEEDEEDYNYDNDRNNEKDFDGKKDGKGGSHPKANVWLDDDRSLDYIALRDIKKGEEIVELKLKKE